MDRALDDADRAFEDFDRDLIRRLVLEILDNLSEGPNLRYHPLGFLKDVFAFDGDRRLQLHVWHPKHSRPQLPQHTCHSHGWQLHSYIICGGLVDRYYEVTQDPKGDHLVYAVGYEAGQNHSHNAAEVSLSRALETATYSVTETKAVHRIAGTFYSIAPDAFHWTDPVGITSTLSYGHLANAAPARNARLRDQPAELAYQRAPVPAEYVEEIAAAIRGDLRE